MCNPFDTLGIPPRFDLDVADLHRRYVRASAANHPDRFVDPLEQADAAERAAEINQAYRTLRHPETRANALLTILGGPRQEDDKALPPDLLEKMLEVREEMEEAAANNDKDALTRLHNWAAEQRQNRLAAVAALFSQTQQTAAAPREPLLRRIRLELNALRYFQRMMEQPT